MQHPAVAVADGDAGVPARVADERDQQNLGIDARQHADALEAEPLVAVDVVHRPLRPVGEVAARIARTVEQLRIDRGFVLGTEGVDLGAGEVGQAAGVIEVEVGAGDVAHVGRVEAHAADPLDRGLGVSPDGRKAAGRDAEAP